MFSVYRDLGGELMCCTIRCYTRLAFFLIYYLFALDALEEKPKTSRFTFIVVSFT